MARRVASPCRFDLVPTLHSACLKRPRAHPKRGFLLLFSIPLFPTTTLVMAESFEEKRAEKNNLGTRTPLLSKFHQIPSLLDSSLLKPPDSLCRNPLVFRLHWIRQMQPRMIMSIPIFSAGCLTQAFLVHPLYFLRLIFQLWVPTLRPDACLTAIRSASLRVARYSDGSLSSKMVLAYRSLRASGGNFLIICSASSRFGTAKPGISPIAKSGGARCCQWRRCRASKVGRKLKDGLRQNSAQ